MEYGSYSGISLSVFKLLSFKVMELLQCPSKDPPQTMVHGPNDLFKQSCKELVGGFNHLKNIRVSYWITSPSTSSGKNKISKKHVE